MWIKLLSPAEEDLDYLKSVIEAAIEDSRFTATLSQTSKTKIKIEKIRLRDSKPYCGNHPASCRIEVKSAWRNYLEGVDWVSFNDGINDILDRLGISANVWTSICIIREGRSRRVAYTAQPNGEWAKYGLTWNYCGREAPASDWPGGTPGIYGWK